MNQERMLIKLLVVRGLGLGSLVQYLTLAPRQAALNDAQTIPQGLLVVGYSTFPAELTTEDVGLASANLRPFLQDAELNKVLYGSADVGFLHREGAGDIGLDYLNVILVIQLGQQRHEHTNLFVA